MTYEESKNLWKLEKMSFQENSEIYPEYSELIEVIEPLIESGELLYDEFTNDFADTFMIALNPSTNDDTIEERKRIISTTIKSMIDKYKEYEKQEPISKAISKE